MEIKTIIPQKEFIAGFYIELECCMCGHNETIAATTKKELSNKIKESDCKWRNINSKYMGIIGWHCGCNYKE